MKNNNQKIQEQKRGCDRKSVVRILLLLISGIAIVAACIFLLNSFKIMAHIADSNAKYLAVLIIYLAMDVYFQIWKYITKKEISKKITIPMTVFLIIFGIFLLW